MIDTTVIKKSQRFFTGILLALFINACGSYQQASYYDNDGIYGDSSRVERQQAPQANPSENTNKDTNTYSDYFGQKASEYGSIADGAIFTDVDSYTSSAHANNDQQYATNYYNENNTYDGYGGWGDNGGNVQVVFQNNGFGGRQFMNPWGWNAGFNNWNNPWGWNAGFGWNNFNNGWGSFGLGFNNWGWGGFGNLWYGGFGRNQFYGRNQHYNRHYGNNTLNASRRGFYTKERSSLRTNNTTISRNANSRNTYRSNNNRNYTRSRVGVDRNSRYRTSRNTRTAPPYGATDGRNNTNYNRKQAPNTNTSRSNSNSSTPARTSNYRNNSRKGNNGNGSSNTTSTSSNSNSSSSRTYSTPTNTRSYNSGSRSSGRSSSSRRR